MKFGRQFKESLKSQGFPSDWVDSAISYSQLKKCINKLTSELAAVGLDASTLSKLLRHVEDYNASTGAEGTHDEARPFEYILAGDDAADGSFRKPRQPFHPKLLFYVNEETGDLIGANLDDDTRKSLQMLAVETGLTDLRIFEEPDRKSIASADSASSSDKKRPGCRTVEVHLTSDSEFFATLAEELSGLRALQHREEKRMHDEIEQLGKQVARMTDPDRKANRKLLNVWREIFQTYIESDIFFGHTESDHAAHDAQKAAERFQKFCDKIAVQGLVEKIKKPEGLQALNTFLHINREILQGLQFGEINHTAMTKILKSKRISDNGSICGTDCC
jgi:E3 ubiquitin-protein ligase BAH